MDNDSQREDASKVKLCEVQGKTSVFIDAEIGEDGGLVISGQDIGEAAEEYWGDSDYEYWLVVPGEEKDRLLLALLEAHYGGDTKLVSKLSDLMKAKGISYKFDSYA